MERKKYIKFIADLSDIIQATKKYSGILIALKKNKTKMINPQFYTVKHVFQNKEKYFFGQTKTKRIYYQQTFITIDIKENSSRRRNVIILQSIGIDTKKLVSYRIC